MSCVKHADMVPKPQKTTPHLAITLSSSMTDRHNDMQERCLSEFQKAQRTRIVEEKLWIFIQLTQPNNVPQRSTGVELSMVRRQSPPSANQFVKVRREWLNKVLKGPCEAMKHNIQYAN